MNGWLDWEEIERHNDWGVREKTHAVGDLWNKDAHQWDERWKREEEFTRRQADALKLLPSDTVLDLCCGTGPLSINVAPRVRRVIAFDYSAEMLELLSRNAADRGLGNIETLQGSWYDMEPGEGLPVCDVAITRWSPVQGSILKMSRCARRYCYSLSTCASAGGRQAQGGGVAGFGAAADGLKPHYWLRSSTDQALNRSARPDARKYGFNVHFNILYDHGANPEVLYVSNGAGLTIAVLGWDPNDVRF